MPYIIMQRLRMIEIVFSVLFSLALILICIKPTTPISGERNNITKSKTRAFEG